MANMLRPHQGEARATSGNGTVRSHQGEAGGNSNCLGVGSWGSGNVSSSNLSTLMGLRAGTGAEAGAGAGCGAEEGAGMEVGVYGAP